MPFTYLYIRYIETIRGSQKVPGEAFYYSASPSTIDGIKTFVQNVVLKNPAALVNIFSLQPLERERYLALGGKAPSE